MKWVIRVFFFLGLIGLPILLLLSGSNILASPVEDSSGGGFLFPENGEGPPAPPGADEGEPPPHPGGRRFRPPHHPGKIWREFREEIRGLGREIRENKQTIQSLEKELEEVEPGVARAEVRKKLEQAYRREAELKLTLASRREEITRRGLEFARQRYDDARLELKKVIRKVRKKYPDLVK